MIVAKVLILGLEISPSPPTEHPISIRSVLTHAMQLCGFSPLQYSRRDEVEVKKKSSISPG
jgi:hypothetical protein